MSPAATAWTPVILFTTAQWAVILSVLFVGLLIHGLLVWWLHRDVQAAGQKVWPWTVAGALLYIPTLLAWWTVRPRPVRDPYGRPRAAPTETGTDGRPGHAALDPYDLGLTRGTGTLRPPPDAGRPDRSGQAAPLDHAREANCRVCGAPTERGTRGLEDGSATCADCGTRQRP